MYRDSTMAIDSSVHGGRINRTGRRRVVLAALAMVILVDQMTKWWAWRHVPTAVINYGGDLLVGARIGDWYADPVPGALLDMVDVVLLGFALFTLLRRPRPTLVLVSGALLAGGWSSNLLDRLVMHYWSAPGSVRGAVDFISVGSQYANVADFFIVGGTLLFLPAVVYSIMRPPRTPAVPGSAPHATHGPSRIGIRVAAVIGGVALATVVGVGAAHHNGLTQPPTALGASVSR